MVISYGAKDSGISEGSNCGANWLVKIYLTELCIISQCTKIEAGRGKSGEIRLDMMTSFGRKRDFKKKRKSKSNSKNDQAGTEFILYSVMGFFPLS